MYRKLISLCRGWLWGGLLGVAVTFAAIHLVTAVVLAAVRPDTASTISGYVLPVVAGVALFILSYSHTLSSFEMLLRFGRTRRRSLGTVLAVIVTEGYALFGLSVLLTALERWAAPPLWTALAGAPGYAVGTEGRALPAPAPGAPVVEPDPNLLIVTGSFPWWAWLLIALGCAVVGIIAGALVQRLGRRAFWLLWGVWLVVILGGNLLPWSRLPSLPWLIPVVIAAVAVLAVWSVWSLLHAVVRR